MSFKIYALSTFWCDIHKDDFILLIYKNTTKSISGF